MSLVVILSEPRLRREAWRALLQAQPGIKVVACVGETSGLADLGAPEQGVAMLVDMEDLLANRDKINEELAVILDSHTTPWGIKVANVEVKNVDLPPEMMRAMAKQAEAERERRAKVIHAEGELQASVKLGEAAEILGRNPASIQLRYLQTLTEVAAEKNSTILFPVPIDMISMFLKKDKA